MGLVQSVLGPIDAAQLGLTLVHEHVVTSSPGILRSWPKLYGGMDRLVGLAVEVLTEAKTSGVDTIVDATPFDLGRDVSLLADVSTRSGVNILASTGHWLDPSATMRARTTEDLADLFIADITEGVDDTNIRAAVIKIASDASIQPFELRVLEAAARACIATGAPIITHTSAPDRTGVLQAENLERCGVDPSRVAIGHSDDSRELDYLVGLARRGYWLAMDRLPQGAIDGATGLPSVADRLDMIAALVDAGFAERILLGHDHPIWMSALSRAIDERNRAANPDALAFISRRVLPGLKTRGLSDRDIAAITVGNPARWLSGG
jgi:phosphotriesterase-related protein